MACERQVLHKINNLDMWVKLVSIVVFIYNSEPIESLSLTTTTLTVDKPQLLEWLAYSKVNPIKTLPEWHDFTR